MPQRPEAKHIRKRMRAALKAGGLDIHPARMLDALTDEVVAIVLSDRDTSAEIVESAARAHETLDTDQLERLADVVRERVEYDPGVVSIELED